MGRLGGEEVEVYPLLSSPQGSTKRRQDLHFRYILLMSSLADRPLRKDAERNRQRILAAAGELFTERGLGVTLDDIARHAGVGVGTVYRRFADKELLIDALFEQRIDAMCEIAEEALAQPDPWDGVVHFFARGSELQARDRGLKELLSCNAHGGGHCGVRRERLRALVTAIFDRAKRAGVVRADADPHDSPIISMMLGVVMDRSRDVEPELWRRYLGLVLDGLRPGAAAPLPVPALDASTLAAVMQRPPARHR
jgi:AcrR family transcriptional regulator